MPFLLVNLNGLRAIARELLTKVSYPEPVTRIVEILMNTHPNNQAIPPRFPLRLGLPFAALQIERTSNQNRVGGRGAYSVNPNDPLTTRDDPAANPALEPDQKFLKGIRSDYL